MIVKNVKGIIVHMTPKYFMKKLRSNSTF